MARRPCLVGLCSALHLSKKVPVAEDGGTGGGGKRTGEGRRGEVLFRADASGNLNSNSKTLFSKDCSLGSFRSV